MTLGLDGATATAPTDQTSSASVKGVQVVPALVVFQSPPVAVATYMTAGLESTTATSHTRPLMLAGPSGRATKSAYGSAAAAGVTNTMARSQVRTAAMAAPRGGELAGAVTIAASSGGRHHRSGKCGWNCYSPD